MFNTRKYIRYSQNKKTEIDLLIYYCLKMKEFTPSIQGNAALRNLYIRQIGTIREKLSSLHEDLQYDYGAGAEGFGGMKKEGESAVYSSA